MRRHNTFSRIAGSTYRCEVCGRNTRNTGVQGLGSRTCPQCFELAGIDNAISDGENPYNYTDEVRGLIGLLKARGGNINHWADLLVSVGGAK